LKGKKYLGDLLSNGKIVWEDMQFASPSSWATYIKKRINPAKKSGCGWNSVKYKVCLVFQSLDLLQRLSVRNMKGAASICYQLQLFIKWLLGLKLCFIENSGFFHFYFCDRGKSWTK